MAKDENSWQLAFNPGGLVLGAAAVAIQLAYRHTLPGRIAMLARYALRYQALRGPMPTHGPTGGTKGGLAPGWISEEFCGGADVVRTDGSSGYTPGTCRTIAWPSSPSGPIPGNLQGTVVEGHKPGFQGDPSYAYSWPYYWDLTRRYTRVTGTEPFAFAPASPRFVPLPKRARPKPKRREKPAPEVQPERVKPEREPRPGEVEVVPPPPRPQYQPRPWQPEFPQELPWNPGFNPLEPGWGMPQWPTPYPLVPGLPSFSPWGDPIRGPEVPKPDPWTVPPVHTRPEIGRQPDPVPGEVPGVGPSPHPAESPGTGPGNGPGTEPKPWERPNDRIVFDPVGGTWKDRRPHINMPPDTKTREIKLRPWSVQVPLVRALGRGTEYCDAVDSFFDALPDKVKAKYDFKSLRKLKGKDFVQARKAFNERNEREKNPLMRSKWGRKATCQVKSRAVYENLKHLNSQDAMTEVFKNLLKNEIQDQAIGRAGQGASQHARQTGQQRGWNLPSGF